ncbi:hypothetical protein GGR51DRAFT_573823 [Nemania sp. FL0031]|nr:hypothetical protein GGR51DRAFT_573823 [Nemania sp. FL0031]
MASTKQEEKIPLFVDENDPHNRELHLARSSFLTNKYTVVHSILFLVHLLLLALNATLLAHNTTFFKHHAYSDVLGSTFSPAEEALEHVALKDLGYEQSPSPYTGEPRPELDQAWSHLLRPTLLRMTEEDMVKMNKTSLALLDGSGYVGYLEAFHMLHCLKRIYQSHHPEHYPE